MQRLTISALLTLSLTVPGLAQSGTQSAEQLATTAAAASPVNQPATLVVTQPHPDAEIEGLLTMLTGSFRNPGGGASGTDPALRWNAARVRVDGLDNAVYVEVSREDSPANPFRQSIAHVFRRQGGLSLRFFDFAGNPGLADAATGLWLAPEVFLPLGIDRLRPSMDLVLERGADGGYTGRTLHPALTTRGGAIEISSDLTLSAGAIGVADRGTDAAGQMVWGRPATDPITFQRAEPTARVQRLNGGLVIIDLVPAPEGATTHVSGGEVAVHYTGWLTDGTRFDSSRQGDRPPMKLRIPGQLIQGWNDGLADIALGVRRRIIIPPALGYGERGAGRGLIPANATLIFDVECVWLDNTQPPPPPPPPTPTPPQPARAPGATPAEQPR